MKELVSKHTKGYEQDGRIVEWDVVCKALNRSAEDCQEKWREVDIQCSRKGPYKAVEDALIRQRVSEHTSAGDKRVRGEVWQQLERELGRPARYIRNRWKTALC